MPWKTLADKRAYEREYNRRHPRQYSRRPPGQGYKHFSPGLEALRLEQRPGYCAICDTSLPEQESRRGRKRLICMSPDCQHAYHQIYGIDRRKREGRKPREWKET